MQESIVKRFMAESLSSIAPIYAYETFIPKNISEAFTRVTQIEIFHAQATRPFALFLDPCTGIPSPRNTRHKQSKKYAPIDFIAETFEIHHPEFVICFDQSFGYGNDKKERMEEKRLALTAKGLFSFYYNSHANFLFVTASATTLRVIRKRLVDKGIPPSRLEPEE